MPVGALGHGDRIQPHLDRLGALRRCAARGDAHAVRIHDRDIAVFQMMHAGGVRQQRGEVAGDEHFLRAEADHDAARAAAPRGVDAARFVFRDGDYGVRARDQVERLAQRVVEAQAALQRERDQLRNHLRVGVALAGHPGLGEALAQIAVVLDDPVLHHDHIARARAVRVRIAVAGLAVRRPAGVADAAAAVGHHVDRVFQFGELAAPLEHRDRAVAVHHRNAGAVVAAVFEPL